MTQRMKFAYNASDPIIPEWKLAYYDFETIDKMIQVMETTAYYYQTLHHRITLISGVAGSMIECEYNISLLEEIKNLMTECSQFFLKFHFTEMRVIDTFAKMVYVEIKNRFDKNREVCHNLSTQQIQDCITILQNIYIESLLLKKMVSYNWKKQEEALNRHEKVVNKFIQISCIPENLSQKRRLKSLIRCLMKDIERFIKQKNIYDSEEEAKENLKELNDFKVRPSDQFPWHYFGLTCGFVLFSIMLISYLVQTHNISIQNSQFFENNFAIWRGASYFILYIWVIGLGIKVMQIYTINYRLIFALDNLYVPTSNFTLVLAAFFTSVYVILYAFYLLSLSQGYISEEQLNRFPGYFWAFMIGFIFLPLPIMYFRSRLYFIKLLFLMFISPCKGVTFKIHWITEQFISFKQPLRDFVYAINFYFIDSQSYYENSFLAGQIIAILFLLLRIIQQIRQGMDKQYFNSNLPYATIKCLLGILTICMSIASYYSEDNGALGVWVAVALTATLYTYRFDLKYDWGLLAKGSNNFFSSDRSERIPFLLNNRISFKPQVYYVVFVLNFFLRLAWTLNISTGVIEFLGVQKYVFTMIISFLEIIRRGIWNVLKIQRQYLNRCEQFEAVIDYTEVEKRVCQIYLERKSEDQLLEKINSEQYMSHSTIQKMRKTFQVAITRQYIAETQENKIQAIKLINSWKLTLDKLAPQINRYRVWGL